MGFAARYKWLPELYEAYSEYIKTHDDVILLLGMSPAPRLQKDEDYMEWFHDLENKFASLGESVKYVGFMSTEMMEYAYTIADRVLFPYSRRLAASGPMAIAIGYKKPIVISSVMMWEEKYSIDFDSVIETSKVKDEKSWTIIQADLLRIFNDLIN